LLDEQALTKHTQTSATRLERRTHEQAKPPDPGVSPIKPVSPNRITTEQSKQFESEYRLQTSKSLRRRSRLHELHGKDLILFKHSLNFLKPLPNSHITVSPGVQNDMFANVLMSACHVDAKGLTGMLHDNRAQRTTS